MENRAFKGVWIPKEIWLSTDLTEGEKLLLVEIDSLDGDQGCFATNEYFAKFFNKSPRQISRLINRLAQKGFISSEVIRGERNEVIRRVIHINPDTYPKYGHDAVGSVDEFDHRGMDGCVQYNNTKENNTTNYYYTEDTLFPNGDPIPCVGKDSSTTEEATSSKVANDDYYPPQPKASDDKERSGMGRMNPQTPRFRKPTVEEIATYCQEQGFDIDPEYFYDYYEANGWIVGKKKMKSYQATLRNWNRRQQQFNNKPMETETREETHAYQG